jgi:hypothetical protein
MTQSGEHDDRKDPRSSSAKQITSHPPLEADLNLALGIIWSRRLMTQGEKVGAFGDEQWGSRNGRSANTVLLLKHLTYEMMQSKEQRESVVSLLPLSWLFRRCAVCLTSREHAAEY